MYWKKIILPSPCAVNSDLPSTLPAGSCEPITKNSRTHKQQVNTKKTGSISIMDNLSFFLSDYIIKKDNRNFCNNFQRFFIFHTAAPLCVYWFKSPVPSAASTSARVSSIRLWRVTVSAAASRLACCTSTFSNRLRTPRALPKVLFVWRTSFSYCCTVFFASSACT